MVLRQDAFFDGHHIGRGLAYTYTDGEQLPRHTHTWAQIVYARSGVMQVMTDTSAWLVPTTRAIYIPPEVPHWIRMRGEVEMASFYVRSANDELWPSSCRAIEVSRLLRELILHLVHIEWLAPDNAHHERLLLLLSELVSDSRAVPLELPLPSDARALELANRILNAPGDGGTLADLATDTGASLRTLQRLFRNETGLPLDVWRLRARMQLAIVLLTQRLPISQVALDCGYANTAAFSSAFKRVFSETPGRYRG